MILIGTVILAVGGSFYAEYQAGVSNDYEPLRGTLQLGWIPVNVTYPMQYFTLQVDITRNRVWLNYGFTYAKSGLYVLQVLLPFTLKGECGRGPSGEDWICLNVYPYGSIVRVVYQANYTGVGYDGAFFERLFDVNQTLAFHSHGTYNIVLPLGAVIPIPLSDGMASFTPWVPVMGSGTADNTVEVVVPFGAVLAQTAPRDPVIVPPENRSLLVLRWSLGHSLPAIAITYTLPGEADHFTYLSFMSGLLIGIGIGVIVDGVVRSYEEETHIWIWNRIRRTGNRPTNDIGFE